MTIKLYEQEGYQTTFHAHVISCVKKNELYDTILDQTLFFPEEGGQTCDKGTLNGIEVVDVQIINDEIHHYTHSALNGDVQGIIDWTHRYTNMQHHTGEHILSGLIHKEFHVDNVGFHLGYNEITADYAMDLNNDQIKRIEALVNSVIFSNKPVKSYYLDDYSNVEYRAKLDLDKPRLVEIEDVDLCACCAPHVKSTIEVGLFKIIKSMKIKKGTHLFFLCGKLAYEDYVLKHDQSIQISNQLSSNIEALSSNVQRVLDENYALKQRIKQLNKEMIDHLIIEHKENQIILCDELDRDTQLYYYNKLVSFSNNYVLLVSKQKDNYRFMTNSKDIFLQLKERHQVRGGGKNDFFQGTLDTVNEQLFD